MKKRLPLKRVDLPSTTTEKQTVLIKLDRKIVDWYKPRHITRMQAVLTAYYEKFKDDTSHSNE